MAGHAAERRTAGLTEAAERSSRITTPPAERYSYVFQGNSPTLDQILVGGRMRSVEYDVVHINAECAIQASDHDPQVVRIRPDQ